MAFAGYYSLMTVLYYKNFHLHHWISFLFCTIQYSSSFPSSDIMEFSLWIFCCADIPQSALLAWFSHRIIPFWYQGQDACKEIPLACTPLNTLLWWPFSFLQFYIFLLVNDWYMLNFSIRRCSSSQKNFTDKFRALYKRTSVSAILFVERCMKQIFRNVLSLWRYSSISFWSMTLLIFFLFSPTCHFSTNLLKNTSSAYAEKWRRWRLATSNGVLYQFQQPVQ